MKRGTPLARWLVILLTMVVAGVLMWYSTMEDNFTLHAGEVAPRDILAPYTQTYTSRVLTEQRQEAAARAVANVYAPPDTSIGRRQLERLRAALTFITAIRADPYATQEEKLHDLGAIKGLDLSAEQKRYLLTMDEARWKAVQQEALRVLETMMRAPIREDQLEEARRNIPAFIDLTMPDKQAALVERLVAAYLAPNSLYSPELTEAARQKARQAVQPVIRTFRRGETIVQRGQVLTPADIEALQQYGLLRGSTPWQSVLAPLLLTLASVLLVALFVALSRPLLAQDLTALLIVSGVGVVFLGGARLLVQGHAILPYLYPLAAYTLLLSLLFDGETAMLLTLPLLALSFYHFPRGFELVIYHAFLALSGMVLLSRVQRMRTFFGAAVGMAFIGSMVVLALRLASPDTDLAGVLTLVAGAVFAGAVASALALVMHYFFAPWLGQVTPLQLLELSRPDHPLLQRLLHDAPGTYQHSLQVANLAEQAARAIGADALLVRVGALYHDVGKMVAPQYFIENKPPGGSNPHDALSPWESARIILNHVPDGLALAQQYNLPQAIRNFIAEHHGTMLTRYQYAKAVEQAGDERKVDPADFRYPGPIPQSRETALVMLADGCEARTRAENPTDEHELRRIVHATITERIREGQLSDANLTLRDLKIIEDTFVTALKGMYHPRIRYPQVPKQRGQATIPRSEAVQTLMDAVAAAEAGAQKTADVHDSSDD